ncbi:MAG: hypothetical protein WKG07_16620 [Hymenobacter sp.]
MPAVVPTSSPAPLWARPGSGRWKTKPTFALQNGQLQLTARPDKGGAALGRPTLAANYAATTILLQSQRPTPGTTAGLAALGDPNNALSVLAGDGKLRVQERRAGKTRTLAETALPPRLALHLRVQDQGGSHYRFAFSPDGRTWTELLPGTETIDGQFLPPGTAACGSAWWPRAPRRPRPHLSGLSCGMSRLKLFVMASAVLAMANGSA